MLRRLRNILLIALFLLGCLWVTLWIVVCQPVWQTGPRSERHVFPERLEKHVRVLSETFYPRDYTQEANLKACAEYIRGEFEKAGARVRTQRFSVGGRSYENIIARFGVDEGELMVLGAHYDACGLTPGADDNASGVAGLIELATLMGNNPGEANVELVAYCLEEPPFFRSEQMGSARHAAELHEQQARVRGVIILEMIGYFSDDAMSQDFPVPLMRLFYPSRGNYITLVGRLDQRRFVRRLKKTMKAATALPVYSINAPESLPGVDFSDHLNYWRYGYNAVMVTDTAFYRNREYHEMGDIWDRLDYQRMSEVVVGVYEAVQNYR